MTRPSSHHCTERLSSDQLLRLQETASPILTCKMLHFDAIIDANRRAIMLFVFRKEEEEEERDGGGGFDLNIYV
jgi:hypothetical protein